MAVASHFRAEHTVCKSRRTTDSVPTRCRTGSRDAGTRPGGPTTEESRVPPAPVKYPIKNAHGARPGAAVDISLRRPRADGDVINNKTARREKSTGNLQRQLFVIRYATSIIIYGCVRVRGVCVRACVCVCDGAVRLSSTPYYNSDAGAERCRLRCRPSSLTVVDVVVVVVADVFGCINAVNALRALTRSSSDPATVL